MTVVENGQWLRIKAVSRKKSLGFNSSFDKKSCLGRMKVVERGLVGIYEDLDELVQDRVKTTRMVNKVLFLPTDELVHE